MARIIERDGLRSLTPVCISLEPRDPRGPADIGEDGERPVSEDAIPRVPSVSVAEFAAALTEVGIAAMVVDGTSIGAPGWLMARTLAWPDERCVRWAPDENPGDHLVPSMALADVAAHIVAALDVTVHLTMAGPGELCAVPGLPEFSPGPGVLIATLRPADVPALAFVTNASLWWTTAGPLRVISGLTSDSAVAVEQFGASGVLLQRCGPWRSATFMADGRVIGVQEWGPAWRFVDPSASDRAPDGWEDSVIAAVRVGLSPTRVDVDAVAVAWDLDAATQRALAELCAQDDPDDPFTALGDALVGVVAGGSSECDEAELRLLTRQGAEVAEGWREPEQLLDARMAGATGLWQTMWDSLLASSTEDSALGRLTRAWLQRDPLYVAVNACCGAACGVAAVVVARRAARATGRRRRRGVLAASGLAGMTLMAVADEVLARMATRQPR